MINRVLFQKEMKSNGLLLLLCLAVLTIYSVMVVVLYNPALGESLRLMTAAMPQLFSAFGMGDFGTTLLDFISSYLYGLLLVVFPALFLILVSGRLVARYVDSGSMAYLLASPHRRLELVLTQAVFLISCLLVMGVYVFLVLFCSSWLFFPGELELWPFLRVNIGVFGLWLFLMGICFLPSCLLNDSRRSAGICSGVVIYSVLVQMVARMGTKFSSLKYITPLTLFDAGGLASGQESAWAGCGILYLCGILMIAIGVRGFCRRDIPV